MHDLKALREAPEAFDKNWARRGLSAQTPDILKLDAERRAIQTRLQEVQQRRNDASKEIGKIKAAKGDATALMEEVAGLKEEMARLEAQEAELAAALNDRLASLPNLLAEDTPDGADETQNKELRRVGEPPRRNDAPDHVAIGEKIGLMDFEAAAKMSGARFTLLRGSLARLERALAQFMLDTHTGEHGYTEISPPLMVRDEAMFGTGQLPKFAEEQFRTTRGDWLVPTAEVPLTNTVSDMILDAEALPLRLTAHTPCFRQEAGAAGKDTRGMIRQHQFYKVEMVSITRPEDSRAEHERMTECAENILKKLGLAFRTVALCSGDIGFGATKTYDIEVWLPGQGTYREISSCSNCGDFQARRMKARLRRKDKKDTEFVHTLNGSGVAVGRALVAVLENYYDPASGTVAIPDVLKKYMGGLEKLSA